MSEKYLQFGEKSIVDKHLKHVGKDKYSED